MNNIKIPYIPPLSPEKNRDRAEDFIKLYGLGNNKIPIDVEILSGKVGYPIQLFVDLKRKYDCKGLVWYNSTKKTLEIYIDNDHYNSDPESCPFTIAEELSHIILQSDVFKQVTTPAARLQMNKNISESNFLYMEQQAKLFASELLLPSNKFYNYVEIWFMTNIQNIKDERPANQEDLLNFISRKLRAHFSLSEFIIKRALIRKVDSNFIPNLVNQYGIKYLEDTPNIGLTNK